MFKGGTSLEKLRIIQRFSEDLDLLVVGEYPSERAARKALKAMLEAAASTTGGTCTGRKSGGDLGTLHSRAYLDLPLEHSDVSGGLADPKSVYIGLGQTGGPRPALDATIEPLLSRELNGAVDGEWDDLTPFAATILHPGRTLIEKLLRVNNFVVDPDRRDTPPDGPGSGASSTTYGRCSATHWSPNYSATQCRSVKSCRACSRCRRTSAPTSRCRMGDSRPLRRSTPLVNSRPVYARNTTRRWASFTTAPMLRHSTTCSTGCIPAGSC
nr:nucleotidyl transferase AbiEii/AbiGii toxin family protein [Mycolicibacterium tusciae]